MQISPDVLTSGDHGAPIPPTSGWRLVDVLLIAAVSVLVLLAGTLGLKLLKADALTLSIGAAALEAITLVGSVYWLGLRRRGLTWQAVGVRPASRTWIWIAIAAGILCLWLTGIVALLTQMLLREPPQNPQLPFIAPAGLTPIGAFTLFLLAGLAIPFAEELFFRGVLYTWLRQRWVFWIAAVASGLIFGAVHGDIAIAAGVAVMGFIQAWVYERSRSIWTTFLIHAINNSFKLILLYALLALGMKIPTG